MGGAVRMKNDAIMMNFFLLLCIRKIKEFKTLRFNRCKKGVCVCFGKEGCVLSRRLKGIFTVLQ